MSQKDGELREFLLQYLAYGYDPITVTFSGELGDDTKVFQMPFNTMLKAIESWHATHTNQLIDEILSELPTKKDTYDDLVDGTVIETESYNLALDQVTAILEKRRGK